MAYTELQITNCALSRKTYIVTTDMMKYTIYRVKDVIFLDNLSQRQKAILVQLTDLRGEIKGASLAEKLHISTRTLQNEVRNINTMYQKPMIQSNNKGYMLNEAYLHELSNEAISDNSDEIKQELLKKLIIEDQRQQIDELADTLYISTSTLLQRLRLIQSDLDIHNLSLLRKHGYLWIEGTELDKRKMISDMIYKEVEPIFLNIETCAPYFEDMDILRIRDITLLSIQKYNCFVEDCYATNLMINIIIALYRMRNGFHIDQLKHDMIIKAEFLEYKIALDICEHYSNHWSLSFEKQDIYYIAMLIMGQIKPELLHQRGDPIHAVIKEDFKEKVKDILLKTFNYYMLPINYETFLYNFVLHVDALIKRAHCNQPASNAIANSIKASCPFIYDVSVYLAKEIEEMFHIHVTDEEIGFISIHIGFVIENSTKESDKIRVLVLCNEYHHIVDNIVAKLKENYAQSIEIINVITDFTQDCFESSADLILSTLPIRIIGKKVIIISPFYTMMDHLKIDRALHECLAQQSKRKGQQLLLTYFHELLFFKDTAYKEKDDVIRFLGNKVEKFGLAEKGFIDSVLKREKMSSTCFFNTFAIPHAIELNAKKTMFCVLVNEDGITWDEHTIKLVFMIAVQQKDRKTFMKIYNGIIQTLCDSEKVDQLVKANNLMEFIECFKE